MDVLGLLIVQCLPFLLIDSCVPRRRLLFSGLTPVFRFAVCRSMVNGQTPRLDENLEIGVGNVVRQLHVFLA